MNDICLSSPTNGITKAVKFARRTREGAVNMTAMTEYVDSTKLISDAFVDAISLLFDVFFRFW